MAIITQPSPPPLHERPRRPRGLIVGALIAAVLVVAGIVVAVVALRGGDKATGTVEATGPGATAATPAPQAKTEEQKIIDVYRGYSKANYAALQGPDPSSPLLAVFATDPQLTAAVTAVRKLEQQGQATRVPQNSIGDQTVTVNSIEGDQAKITVCSVDDGWLVHADTREPLDPAAPGRVSTTLFVGDMVREPGGVWKLSALTRTQRWEGVAGCAARR